MKIKFNILVLLVVITVGSQSFAQEYYREQKDSIQKNEKVNEEPQQLESQKNNYKKERAPCLKKIYVGGGFGLGGFNDTFYFNLSPMVGYMVTDRWSVGTGITYRFFRDNLLKVSISDYGIQPFTRYLIGRNFLLHGEYELLNYGIAHFINASTFEITRKWASSLFVGGGFNVPIGRIGGFNILMLYNVLYNPETSPYASPFVFRIGATFGLFSF